MNIKNLWQIAVIILITVLTAEFAIAQKKAPGPSKPQLVSQLIGLTVAGFPSNAYQKGIAEGKKGFKQELLSAITQKLEASDKFTATQKNALKLKLPQLAEMITTTFDNVLARHLTVDDWVRESLTRNLSKNFTAAELRQLVVYFKGADGQFFVKFLQIAAVGILDEETGAAKRELDKKTELIVGKFIAKPIGHKFFEVFLKLTSDDVDAKASVAFENVMKDLTRELNPDMLNQWAMELLNKDS